MTVPVLICPACRRLEGGDLYVWTVEPDPAGLRCACGATYPVIDGVPLLFRDLDAWLASEGAEAFKRADLPAAAQERLLLGAGGALARNASLVATYARSRNGPLQDWLRATMAAAEGPVLELGSGLGASDRADVVALDHNLALLRHHPGVRVCGDAADPPFLPASFSTVVLANLLDSCADPGLVLAQADALLRPGGRLVVTCAFAFQDTITPRAHRFTPGDLVAALSSEGALGGHRVNHRVLEQIDPLPWPIRLSDRTTHLHDTLAIISEKSTE